MHVGQGGAKEASDLLRSTPSMTDRRLQEPTEKGFIRSSKKAFLSVYLFVLWFVTAVPLFTNLGKIMHQAEKKKKKQRAQVFSKWHLGSYLSVSPSCHFPRLCLSPSSANPTSCPKEKLQLHLKTLWHICYWLSLICGEEGRLTVSALSPGFLPLSPVLPSLLATRLTSPCHELLHQAPH